MNDDDVDFRVMATAVLVVGFALAVIALPFALGGVSALVDLAFVGLLVVVTYLWFNPPSGIRAGWLAGRGDAAEHSTPAFTRLLDWLSRPASGHFVLSIWPPMIGALGLRVIDPFWAPPKEPLVIYAVALVLFAGAVGVLERFRMEEGAAPEGFFGFLSREGYEEPGWRLLPLLTVATGLLWFASFTTLVLLVFLPQRGPM